MVKDDLDYLATKIADKLTESKGSGAKRFLKSAEARRMLGGISAAKLQSLRIGGHLPAINADGLWLYDVEDIMKFINRNKIGGEEASRV